MHIGLANLIETLKLQQCSEASYRGSCNVDSGGRAYGGQVMAQSLRAAQFTIGEGLIMHSMQAQFLRGADLDVPVDYRVSALMEGRSFATRRVDAFQHDQLIFSSTSSFQRNEEGPAHQVAMPEAAGPEGLEPESVRLEAFAVERPYGWPFEYRHVEPVDIQKPVAKEPRCLVWFKAADQLPEDQALQAALLAYASDNPILLASLQPHKITPFMPGAMLATLNHSLWIHKPIRLDKWALFEVDGDRSGGGRGMGRLKVFSAEGELLASAVQEGVLRYRTPDSH